MSSLPISLCMIVKNEERFLPTCLESCAPHVDEIIIVDTGSTDRTIEIAESFGATIYHYKWDDDFAAARNKSISHATKAWILQLDADEVITDQSWEWFYDSYPWNSCHGYDLIIDNIIDLNSGELGQSNRMTRFFKNHQNYRYQHKVHEFIQIPTDQRELSDAHILHKGYADTKLNKQKLERNEKILRQQLNKNPNDPTLLAFLANTSQDNNEAVNYAWQALEHGASGPTRLRSLREICKYAVHNTDLQTIHKIRDSVTPNEFPELPYYYGMYYHTINSKSKAARYFREFIHISEKLSPEGRKIRLGNERILQTRRKLASYLVEKELYNDALDILNQIPGNTTNFKVFDLKAECYLKQRNFEKSLENYSKVIQLLESNKQSSEYDNLINDYKKMVRILKSKITDQ